jgi:hypothetical protein
MHGLFKLFTAVYKNVFKANTPNNPIMPTMVSMMLHVLNVSFMLNPKYSLKIQNPVSFT